MTAAGAGGRDELEYVGRLYRRGVFPGAEHGVANNGIRDACSSVQAQLAGGLHQPFCVQGRRSSSTTTRPSARFCRSLAAKGGAFSVGASIGTVKIVESASTIWPTQGGGGQAKA